MVTIGQDRRQALVAAIAHVLSPGGLFLSAPCAESTFSLLSFAGYLLLARGCLAGGASRAVLTLLAGAAFGLATAFRSNGILNGLPFAWEFLQGLLALVQFRSRTRQDTVFVSTVRRLIVLGFSGILVALGSVIPQAVAHQHFCSGSSGTSGTPGTQGSVRPWCTGYLPSIYAFVQARYWYVQLLPCFSLRF